MSFLSPSMVAGTVTITGRIVEDGLHHLRWISEKKKKEKGEEIEN